MFRFNNPYQFDLIQNQVFTIFLCRWLVTVLHFHLIFDFLEILVFYDLIMVLSQMIIQVSLLVKFLIAYVGYSLLLVSDQMWMKKWTISFQQIHLQGNSIGFLSTSVISDQCGGESGLR